MQVNEEEYTQKLIGFSKSTMQMIMDLATSSKNVRETYKIVMESETEEEAVRKLKELQNTTLTKTEKSNIYFTIEYTDKNYHVVNKITEEEYKKIAEDIRIYGKSRRIKRIERSVDRFDIIDKCGSSVRRA